MKELLCQILKGLEVFLQIKEADSKALNTIIAGKSETCLPQVETGSIDLQL